MKDCFKMKEMGALARNETGERTEGRADVLRESRRRAAQAIPYFLILRHKETGLMPRISAVRPL